MSCFDAQIRYGELAPVDITAGLAVLQLAVDGGSICGQCSLGAMLDGQCFVQDCSNKTTIDFILSTLLEYIETSDPVAIPPGGTLTLKHVNRFCSATTIVLLECILALKSLHEF